MKSIKEVAWASLEVAWASLPMSLRANLVGRQARSLIWLFACACAVSLASCGPTHTSGTAALPADQRAVLTVHHEIARPFLGPEHVGCISTVWIDGLPFPMDSGASRQFWLTPGEHVLVLVPSLTYASGWGPSNQPASPASMGLLQPHSSKVAFIAGAGRHYEIWGLMSSAGLSWHVGAKDDKPVGGCIIDEPRPAVAPGGPVSGL